MAATRSQGGLHTSNSCGLAPSFLGASRPGVEGESRTIAVHEEGRGTLRVLGQREKGLRDVRKGERRKVFAGAHYGKRVASAHQRTRPRAERGRHNLAQRCLTLRSKLSPSLGLAVTPSSRSMTSALRSFLC